jgi:hypothetical protein
LKGDHLRIISAKFGWDWHILRDFLWTLNFYRLCKLEKRGDEIKKKSSPVKLLSQSQSNFAEMILGCSSSKTVSGISELRPGTILVEGLNRRTHFWQRTIQWLFHQNLVLIEQMVSHKKIFMGISHRMEPVAQLEPNFDKIVIGWSSFKIVSGGPALWPRWLHSWT